MNILVAQNDPLLNLLLSKEIVGLQLEGVITQIKYVKNYDELVKETKLLNPTLIITDLLGEGSKWAIEQIRKEFPQTKILVYREDLNMKLDLTMIDGYCQRKKTEKSEILVAMRALTSGAIYFDSPITQLFRQNILSLVNLNLSPKEIEILQGLVKGKSDVEIAKGLNLSKYTIKKYVNQLMGKFQVNKRSALVARALETHKVGDLEKSC